MKDKTMRSGMYVDYILGECDYWTRCRLQGFLGSQQSISPGENQYLTGISVTSRFSLLQALYGFYYNIWLLGNPLQWCIGSIGKKERKEIPFKNGTVEYDLGLLPSEQDRLRHCRPRHLRAALISIQILSLEVISHRPGPFRDIYLYCSLCRSGHETQKDLDPEIFPQGSPAVRPHNGWEIWGRFLGGFCTFLCSSSVPVSSYWESRCSEGPMGCKTRSIFLSPFSVRPCWSWSVELWSWVLLSKLSSVGGAH